jgi:DNA-binding PadR family transcriptional regulator
MARRKTRLTRALKRVAVAVTQNPAERIYGYRLMQRAHVLSSTLYPILDYFVDNGWAVDGWEGESTGRLCRYYELTPEGRAALGTLAGVN